MRPIPIVPPVRRVADRQRGVALLLVLVALVLVSALALEVAQTAAMQARVGSGVMYDFLLHTAVEGRVHILRSALRYDATGGDRTDTENDDWAWKNQTETLSAWGERAEDLGPRPDEQITFRNTDVLLRAWCEDERSKLNLLGLNRPAGTPERRHTEDAFVRLVDEYREEWSSLDLGESDGRDMLEDLVEWLEDQSEQDENPMPNVSTGRGRLQSLEDLLRVPGGKWTPERLLDVQDPDFDPEDDDERDVDDEWRRMNGAPGLFTYLTVHAEAQANAPLRININTAPEPVLRAMFDAADADLAEAIIEFRREGADDDESDTPVEDDESAAGYFKNKGDLTRVEGMAETLDEYPRLNYFAETSSSVFSLRVIASMVTGSIEGDPDDDDDEGPRDTLAQIQYREVVQRTDRGFQTLFCETRNDPIFDDQQQQ